MKTRILIVDDSKTQLQTVALLLQKEGYDVEKTADPLLAKSLLQKGEFDLLLCDLIMPAIDGLGLLKLSKSLYPNMPVIIMTAFGDRKSAIQALMEGAEDYIFKANGEREREEFIIRIRRTLEKSKLQKNILAYQTQLEQMVEDRTQQLKEAQERLIQSERLRSLGVITSGIAHDFNNILGVILGRTQLLLRKLKNSEAFDDLSIIEKSARKGSATIRRMQDYTRIRKDEAFIPLHLNDLFEEVIEMTKTRWKDDAETKGIQIEIEKSYGDIPLVSGDASELKDVMINVIFNSLDAMPRGGKLTIKTYSENIENSQWVTVEIHDTGTGIAPEIQAKIFDPFFTTKNEHGTGLGMSTAYGIIQRHKGDIHFESHDHGGTTFYIRLMAALFVQQVLPEKPSDSPFDEKKRKLDILVVDDDEAARSTLAEMLETQAHHVISVSSGKEALNMIGSRHFDIVFTDLGMPGMSGWEVSQEIKKRSPATHIIMITGWGTQLDQQKASETGIRKILPKPVSCDEIIDAVRDCMKSL